MRFFCLAESSWDHTVVRNKIIGLWCFIILFGICSTSLAQQSKIPEIKNSDTYYWGEFCSEHIQVASDNALQELISKIAVRVSSQFESKLTESTQGDSSEIKEKTKNVVKTYSTATLKNLQSIKYPGECGITVFNYITKKQVGDIFTEREDLVKDLFLQAREFEGESNYAGALKLYNFSLVLMNSIPKQSIEFGSYNLTTFIPTQVNSILGKMEFDVTKDQMVDDKTREITLSIKADGEPVQRLDFSYWNGNTQVHSKGKDGRSVIQLYGSSTMFNSLGLKVKYQYYQQRHEIKQVGQLWNLVTKPHFENRIKLSLKKDEEKEEQNEHQTEEVLVQANSERESSQTNKGEMVGPDEYPQEVKPQTDMLTPFFNEDKLPATWKKDAFLKDKLKRVEDYNQLSILENTDTVNINKTFEGWEGRKLPALGNYETLHVQTNEYLVPDFNEEGYLTDVNFGVMDGFYEKFQYQSTFGNDWKERKVIIKFMEKYRTAFLSRDVGQLKRMFADKAVIIVGRVLKEEGAADQYKYEKGDNQPKVEYLEYTKNEYLKRQAELFEQKKDILLEFSTFNIHKKNNKPGIYGISLRQQYYSTNYSDEGYLFLLVDFNSEKPKIYVRAWQPQEWSEESLIGLGNFNINY